MEGKEHASECHGSKNVKKQEDVDDQVASFRRQFEFRECDDDLYKDEESKQESSCDK